MMFERLNFAHNEVTFAVVISAVITTVATTVIISAVTFNSSPSQ